MRRSLLAAVSVSPLLLFALPAPGYVQGSEPSRISEAAVHENLAIYFIHGRSAPGNVPLTLEEGMASGKVKVRETSNVNQLEIENFGDEEVFVQSGDIVKGGKQDRTLMVSLVLPPRSGAIPIASFCVEQGRWTARGGEDSRQFSTASASVPSRELKLAMKAPVAAAPPDSRSPAIQADTGTRQKRVWDSVRDTQARLSGSIGVHVQSAQSASSLQLALENEKLAEAQRNYVAALKAAGESSDDIVGLVFAVNGEINSADVYPSNGLFRKMWSKLLAASIIEAISHKNNTAAPPPSVAAVEAFLARAEAGKASAKSLNGAVQLETREAENALFFETARVADSSGAAGGWVHRNYLAK